MDFGKTIFDFGGPQLLSHLIQPEKKVTAIRCPYAGEITTSRYGRRTSREETPRGSCNTLRL
jgi:hypothetical protein